MALPVRNKNGMWSTRVVIPKELRPIIGRTELKRSLGTKEEREAKLLHPTVLAEFQAEIEKARRKLESDARLTDGVIEAVIFEWKKAVVERFYGDAGAINPYLMKSDGLIEGNNLPVLQVLDDIENLKRKEQLDVARGESVDLERKARQLLKYHNQLEHLLGEYFKSALMNYGVEPNTGNSQYVKLLVQFAGAYIEITQSALKKQVSNIDLVSHGIDLERMRIGSPVEASGDTFEEVWDEYKKSTLRRESSKGESRLRDYSSAIEKFLKMYPNKTVRV